ncbi:MAG: O-antigen ligase family protein [Lentisphaerota bacterium]
MLPGAVVMYILAGIFFVLMLSLSAGYVLREMAGLYRSLRWGMITAGVLACLLMLLAANLTLSRAAILLSWGGVGVLVVLLIKTAWPSWSPPVRVNALALLFALCLVGFFLVILLGGEAILREFQPEKLAVESYPMVTRAQSLRLTQPAGFKIWLNHLWVGTGGWGFRYLLGLYADPSQWSLIIPGSANVHNDPLQFLAEFGLLGVLPMAITLIILLIRATRSVEWWRASILMPFGGVFLLLLYSFMDIPFRSPAILYSWLAMISILPALASRLKVDDNESGRFSGRERRLSDEQKKT